MSYQLNGTTIEHDEEGYITDISLWSKELAGLIAEDEDIDMSDDHWEVVNFLRNYYEEYQIAPAVRVLTKAIKKTLGPEKGNSQYLYELFPYGPANQACKIDRKSTRLNSSHVVISYAVFCLKKKKKQQHTSTPLLCTINYTSSMPV